VLTGSTTPTARCPPFAPAGIYAGPLSQDPAVVVEMARLVRQVAPTEWPDQPTAA